MIDFSRCTRLQKSYGGERGKKLCVEYDGKAYMLKFSPHIEKYNLFNEAEYIGCHIYAAYGISSQKTLLGCYSSGGCREEVVACKDFVGTGEIFDFADLKNLYIDSNRNDHYSELDDILFAIDRQEYLDADMLEIRFWEMFVIDAFLGNKDRNCRNWGGIKMDGQLELAPVFDCASSFYPHVSDDEMEVLLSDDYKFERYVNDNQGSAIQDNGKKIQCFDFLKKNRFDKLNDVKKRLQCEMDKNDIVRLIGDMTDISDLHRRFYTRVLCERYGRVF